MKPGAGNAAAYVLAFALLGAACGRESPSLPASPLPERPLAAPADAGVPVPAASVERREALPALVLNFEGTVEVQRAGTEGWVAMKIGDAIRQGDAVRTSPDGQLEFAVGEAHVRVESSSELFMRMLDPSALKVDIQGHVEADARGDARTVELAGTQGGARTSLEPGGRVAFSSDATGRSSAVALAGTATFTGAGAPLQLQPGEFTTQAEGHSPSRPARIPSRISLRIRWPERRETNRAQVSLRGQISAFSSVRVQGHRVEAKPDGTFSTELRLHRGAQRVVVVATDVLGRRAQEARVLTLDETAPTIKGQVRYR